MKSPLRLPVLLRLFGLLAALPLAATAQQTAFKSHEVNHDRSVTFRYYGPTAKAVTVDLDYDHHHLSLAKGTDGVWTLTTAPLLPAPHMYTFTVDGTPIMDPLNPQVDVNLAFLTNVVTVPGAPQLWDLLDVPHGVVHHHVYRSTAILGLPEGLEDFYVYTPPGYDAGASKVYPTLYLLHGWSSSADSWTQEGKVHLMLDNLIAQGRVLPMVVVMPTGYGDMSFVTGGFNQWYQEATIAHNLDHFSQALLTEILPRVQAGYRVSVARDDHAIAGLSMGGGESLVIGLRHPETFGWIGGFSAAVMYKDFGSVFPSAPPRVSRQLLWVSCGTEDDLIGPNRKFVAWLRAKGFQPMAIETPGIHNWPVWRDNFIHFAPLLFRPAGP